MRSSEPVSVQLRGYGGIPLAATLHDTNGAVATLLLCHGVCEHQGRYARFFQTLVSKGVRCIGFDLRGHGRSGGARGHVDRFEDYLADLDEVIGYARGLESRGGSRATIFLFGHSMGGVVAARYLEEASSFASFGGLLLSSPGFVPNVEIPRYKRWIASLLTPVAPSLRLPTAIASSAITSDPEEARAYATDPGVQSKVSLRWYAEFEAARRTAMQQASSLKLPIYGFCGSDDTVVSPQAVEQFVSATGASDRQYRLWEGLRHETLNERAEAREAVTASIVDWVVARARSSSGAKVASRNADP